jgi:hypothetical protein
MLTRAVGIYACLLFALAAVGIILSGLLANKGAKPEVSPGLKTLFPMPALVLEFARAGQDVREIISNVDDEQVQHKLQKDLRGDSLFITLYLLLYVGIALVLGQEGGGVRLAMALAAVVCAVGAAASDGMENLAMARAVEIRASARVAARSSPQAAEDVRASANEAVDIAKPGFMKWALSFATLALLSFTFLGRGSVWATCVFWLSVSIAVLGAAGLLILKANPAEFRPLQLAFSLMLPLVLLVGLLFFCEPDKFDAALPPPLVRAGEVASETS